MRLPTLTDLHNHFWLLLFFTLATLVCSVSAHGKSANITNAQQALIKEFITMFNSKESQAVSQFVDSHIAKSTLARFGEEGRSRYIGYLSGEKKYHGAFELKSITAEAMAIAVTPYLVKVRSTNTELHYNLMLNVTNQLPVKITRIRLRAINEVEESVTKISRQAFTNELSQYIDRLATRGIFSGAVLVAENNNILYKDAKGLASIRYQVNNNIDTKFNLGSMNKMFTAISIMQLVEQKKLSLTDKLVKFIDRELFGEGEFEQITIQQLLTHTAGLGWANYPELSQNSLRNLNDHKPYLKHIPMDSSPGTQARYSNEGMMMLGMVIETISGTPYDDYVQQHIFDVAGMTNTGNFAVDLPIANLALGYFHSAEHDSMQSNLFIHPIKGGPAGGGYSTVEDMFRFARTLTGYKLLPQPLTELVYSPKPELNSPSYGYGFYTRGKPDDRIIGHDGSFIGISSYFRVHLDTGFTVIVLANQSFASDPVSAKINQLIKQL